MGHPNVAQMPIASTTKAHTVVSASMDIMVMDRYAMTSMSAVKALVTRTQFAETQTDHITVAAIPASRVTEFHVLIMMSAKRMLTTVTRKLFVIILGAHIAVPVLKAIVETVKSAKVSVYE